MTDAGADVTTPTMPPTESAPPRRATRREWIGLAVLALACLLYVMDLTVLHLAVPAISRDLQPTSAELLWAAREVAARVEVVGADLVEVIPTAIGTADSSALAGVRTVREILTGIAMRRLGVAAAG